MIRLPLPGALGLCAIAALTAFVVISPGQASLTVPQQVEAKDLLFLDAADGGVSVLAAGSQQQVALLHGEQGFLRGTLRGFARTRRLDQVGEQIPFHLARWSDGRLTLDDPVTGGHVELLAFGPTNAGVFAALLEPQK